MANGTRRGKPARAVKIARTPPTNSAFTTSSTVLFCYSTVLHQHPPTSSSSPRGGPWPPQGAHRARRHGTGRPRRPHLNPYSLPKGSIGTWIARRSYWRRRDEQRCRHNLPPRRWLLTCKSERVPVSNIEGEASARASEHQGALTDTPALTVRLEAV